MDRSVHCLIMPSFSKQLLGFSKSVKMLLGVEKMALCGSEDDGTIGKKSVLVLTIFLFIYYRKGDLLQYQFMLNTSVKVSNFLLQQKEGWPSGLELSRGTSRENLVHLLSFY